MKLRFILNPSSRGSVGVGDVLSEIRKRFSSTPFKTRSWQDAVEQTRRSLHEGVDHIVVLGGDGTLNAVVNGFFEGGRLVNPSARITVSRWGTGSDYFRMISKISGRDDWLNWIEKPEARPVNVGTIEFEDSKFETRYFLNIASIGINARVAQEKNAGPSWLPPALSYVIPTAKCLLTKSPIKGEVKTANKSLEVNVLTLTVALGHYAGAGMKFGGSVPFASGDFDIKVAEDLPLARVARELPKLYTGGLESTPAVHCLAAPWVEIRTQPSAIVEFDGEIHGETPVRMSVHGERIPISFG